MFLRKKTNKKGFTLIELLAVITILAIIALIVAPIVSGIVKKVKDKADYITAQSHVTAAKKLYTSYNNDNKEKLFDGSTNVLDIIKIDGTKASTGSITISSDGKIKMAIIINKKCYMKDSNTDTNDIQISDNLDECSLPYSEAILNGADPILSEGMIPVTILNDGTVNKADLKSKWYNYEDKKWANMVIVNEASRSKYEKAPSNTIISLSDILGYFVWIPRYKYELFNATGAIGTSAQEIQIKFENKSTPKSTGIINGKWLTAPGFTFGSD